MGHWVLGATCLQASGGIEQVSMGMSASFDGETGTCEGAWACWLGLWSTSVPCWLKLGRWVCWGELWQLVGNVPTGQVFPRGAVGP